MSRQSYKAVERHKKIASMSKEEAEEYLRNEKRVEPEGDSAGSAAWSGSAATCEWLSTLNTEETCGKPATHERMMGKAVRYCTEHALMLAKYCELRTIKPPNDQAQ